MKYNILSRILGLIFYVIVPHCVKYHIWPEKIENRPLFLFFLIFLAHEISYSIYNITLYFIYKLEHPFFEQFKVHNEIWPWKENKNEFLTLLKRSLKQIFFNQLIILPVLLFTNIIILNGTKCRVDLESFPSVFEMFWQIYIFILCDDFLFYWSHRLLHWNRIYPYIHKKHHEYKITIGIASEYAHPIEFVFGNILPTSLGSMILGNKVHAFTFAYWICLKIYNTTEGHSGYQFPWSPSRLMPYKVTSEHHNFHHLKFIGNYGGYYNLWDWICGTNHPDYLKSKEKKKKHN
jgi:sterol desaturase/sphingolipid hydroxylase (fatty acid hydroxylase superfamily)